MFADGGCVQVLSAEDARTTSLTEAERAACMSLPMPGKQEPVVLAAQDAAARSAWVEMLRTIASGQIEVRWCVPCPVLFPCYRFHHRSPESRFTVL